MARVAQLEQALDCGYSVCSELYDITSWYEVCV
jgi:hypothetical protein